MNLEFESGLLIENATEGDLYAKLFEDEAHAILAVDDLTYLQCALRDEPPGTYFLEYQDGSLNRHFRVSDGPVLLDRVLTAFQKYLRGDESWRFDFTWEKLELWNFNFIPPEGVTLPSQRIPDLITGIPNRRRRIPGPRLRKRPRLGRKKRDPRSN